MTKEEYNDLFHRAELNLVAFKMVNHCDDEIKHMVEMAIAAEREACARICDTWPTSTEYTHEIAAAIRGKT